MWNGQDAARVSAHGAEVNGIEKMAEKIVSRGVLLDIARFKGLEALVPGYPVTGLLVGEIFDLEKIAEDCAADKVYEVMFVAPPLPITGAVGSPINPQAIK